MQKHACSCETSAYLSFHSDRKCKQCMKGERNKVNIALVLAIITALGDKRPAKCLTCPVGAALQHWSATKLVLTWTQQQLSGTVNLRSEVWKVTKKACPSSCQSTKRHLFSTESHRKTVHHPVRACCPRAERGGRGEEEEDRDREKRDTGSRRKKMVSGESRSPSELEKSFSCCVHWAKMAASGVQRGNRRR